MDQTFLSTLPLWIINLLLAGFVWIREPRRASHQAFATYVLTMVMWSVCVKMTYAHVNDPTGVFWARLTFITASFIGHSFVVFCQVFPDRSRLQMSPGAWGVILLGCAVTILTFTPLVLSDVGISDTGDLHPSYGPLYRLFGIFMLAVFGQGLWTLALKWKASRGRSRQQIRYLLLGLGLAIAGGTTTNLILPTVTGSSRFSIYGPYFTLFFVGLTAHAIIRHRLLDIRLAIRQSVTYGLSLGVTVATIWTVLAVVTAIFDQQFVLQSSTLALCAAAGGVAVFHPVRVALQSLLDRYCYREPYDYRQATRTMSQVLAGLVRLGPLGKYLSTFILDTLKVDAVAVYVRAESGELEHCVSCGANGDHRFLSSLSATDVTVLSAYVGEALSVDELQRWAYQHDMAQLKRAFTSLHSEVLVPMVVEDQITALIAVGGKLSGDPFFTRDLDLLSTVGHQASVALRRAQLYEEISWMKEYSESILRQMQSGVIVISQKGFVTMINAAAARLMEVTVADVIGGSVFEVLPEALSLPLLRTLEGTDTYTNHEGTLYLASQRVLPIAISTSVLHGPEGQPTGSILVFHDLSRLKELEEEKRRIEHLASLGAFVSGITHEIKNPLVAIKTFAELLPHQYDDQEFRETFTKVALHEVERIDTLIQRLRGMGTSPQVQMRPISILTTIDETLALISGELTKRNIALRYENEPSVCSVMGNHDQLKQIFLNLCLNSIEAMEADGILSISVGVDKLYDGAPSKLVVQISDTGPGIPEEYFPTIFEPFVTSKDTGSGLGLAICKGIIEAHRGSIHATNRPDGFGTTFTVRLPVVQGDDVHEVIAHRGYHAPASDPVARTT